jgi:hypothetical protein
VRADGLVEGHAFSLLRLVTLEGRRLLQLRNPWGSEKEWRGAWADGSAEWAAHPQIARAVGHEPGANGLFWMAWDDFERIFDWVAVCSTTDAHGFEPEHARRGVNAPSSRTGISAWTVRGEAAEEAPAASAEDSSIERLRRAFHMFDADGSGTLSPAELKAILTRPGSKQALTEEDAALIVADFDIDGDACLSFDEFVRAWSSLTHMPPSNAGGFHV